MAPRIAKWTKKTIQVTFWLQWRLKHRSNKFMANQNQFRWGKWLLILLIVAAIIGGVIWHFSHGETPPQFQTAAVSRGELVQAVTATGQLNPVTNVTVGSQISGIIQKLNADYNTLVKQGEVIAQLDPATYKAAVQQSEGDLANAQANEELTQVEANRATELFKSKLISQSDYDKAVADLHQAQAQVKIKEAALSRSQVDLSRCTIYAPVDGIVISRSVDVGQTVAASLSAPTLFIIANDLTKMQIDANVAEADVGGVEPGQEVNFTVDAFPYRTFHGEVVQVRNSPITVQNVVSYDTVISVSNPDMKLKPGMTANVSIIVAQKDNALKIPNAALRFRLPESLAPKAAATMTNAASTNAPTNMVALENQRGGGRRGGGGRGGQGGGRGSGEHPTTRTVYILSGTGDEAKPKPIQIKTGISDGVTTEVLDDNLKEGDQVITSLVQADSPAQTAPPNNPFGGGLRRMGR